MKWIDLINLAALKGNLPIRQQLVLMEFNPRLDPSGLTLRKAVLALRENLTGRNVKRGLMSLIPDTDVRFGMLAPRLANHANDYSEEH